MTGVTWDERKEGWWLASNGRWYAPDSYPRGWNMSALPPAPGQVETGAASQVLRRLRGALDIAEASPATMPATLADTRDTPSTSPQSDQFRPQPQPTAARTPPPRPSPSRPSAQAQNAAARVERERQAASATVSSSSTHKSRLPSAPPAPAQLPPPSNPPSPPARRKAPPPPQNVVAGDLGSVFGAARAKIEKAINEAAEQR